MTLSDQELLHKIEKGEVAAFEMLLGRYQESLRRHLLSIVRDNDATNDLLQEIALRIWLRAGQWSGRGPVKTWLFRIATNLAFNHLRTLRRRKQQPLELAPDEYEGEDDESVSPSWLIDAATLGPDALIEKGERFRALRSLVAGLPQEKREVFVLAHEVEMETRQIAEKLGIPEGTVKSRLHYANKWLAREWEGIEKEWEEI